MSYYIYKHINKDNQVVYVGQTINMESRQSAHKNSSEWKDTIYKIEYAEVTDSLLMDIYEKYYISKYNPINNKEYIECQYSRFFTNLEELKFIEYKTVKVKKERKPRPTIKRFSECFEEYYKESINIINMFKSEFYKNGYIKDGYAIVKNNIICNFVFKNNQYYIASGTFVHAWVKEENSYLTNTKNLDLNLDSYNHLKSPEQLTYKSLDEMWQEIFLDKPTPNTI